MLLNEASKVEVRDSSADDARSTKLMHPNMVLKLELLD
jgi:hypothetical protein